MPQPSDEPSPSLFDRARALFDRTWEVSPAERSAWVLREANGDTKLVAEVMALLAAATQDDVSEGQDAVRQWLAEQAPDDGAEASPESGPDRVQATAPSDLLAKLATAPKLDTTRYRLEGRVGQGGMGVVRRIHDQQLNRRLAMKVPLDRSLPTNDHERQLANQLIGRFLEEAQVTSQLDHPGVVPVHELGLDQQGKVYFTMRLVKGRTAHETFRLARARREDWTTTRALEVILKVCDTMAYAHDKGVVHRDLKPGNVMVGSFGEVYVLDWGVAKVLDQPDRHDLRIQPHEPATAARNDTTRQRGAASDEAVVSLGGQKLGTPSYMSPEQARSEALDARADVYSIGAMLYDLLTGRAPYTVPGRKVDGYQILRGVVEGPPRRIEEIEQGVPAELVAIVDKAMARDREQRYASATALAGDLRAFLGSQVVSAYRTGALVELQLWVRRNKPLAASLVAAVLILVGGITASTWLANENAATVRNFNQLGADVRYRRTIAHEADLWPAVPKKVEAMERWLRDECGELLAMTPEIQRTIDELRSQALPLTPEQVKADRRSHPRFAEYELLSKRVATLRYARAIRSGLAKLVVPDLPEAIQALSTRELGEFALERAAPQHTVWGEEALGLAAARAAVERAEPEQLAAATLSLYWAMRANGQDVAAQALARQFSARAENDLLVIDFEDDLTGHRGERPIRQSAIEFTTGIAGRGALFGAESVLLYSSKGAIDDDEGTFEVWLSPRWNGSGHTSHYLLRYGRDGGLLLGKDGGGYMRLIMNRFGAKERGASFPIAHWQPDQWHHVAFTWSNRARALRIHVDGAMVATKQLQVSLPTIQASELQIGGDDEDSRAIATLDGLRLSRVALESEELSLRWLALAPNGVKTHDEESLKLEADLATLARDVEARRTWLFAATADGEAVRFLYDTLAVLPGKLSSLATKEKIDVEQRLRWAKQVQTVTRAHPLAKVAWQDARAAIAKADGLVASTLYAGISIPLPDEAVIGLVPIGMNPVTKLWEFYELRSAWNGKQALSEMTIPTLEPDGSIEVTGETGIVFVLLPGGKVRLGSQGEDKDAPYYDPQHQYHETLHDIALAPFFLARHEMTQGQWSRLCTWDASLRMPSQHQAGTDNLAGNKITLAYPVEQVDWTTCDTLLTRHGMVLPSEAQWEYGCRGATTSVWWPGDSVTDLAGTANVRDETGVKAAPQWGNAEPFDDHHVVQSPVGSFAANRYGLFDVHGNVMEWCDEVNSDFGSERTADGLRLDLSDRSADRPIRGGSFGHSATGARSAYRGACAPWSRSSDLGLRPARLITY
jgi:serine/threonine protein kinase/formylglycine-generating enzyme required for sulfatase activity